MNAGEIAVVAWGMVGFVGVIVFAMAVIKQQVDIKIQGEPEKLEEVDLGEPIDAGGDAPPQNLH